MISSSREFKLLLIISIAEEILTLIRKKLRLKMIVKIQITIIKKKQKLKIFMNKL